MYYILFKIRGVKKNSRVVYSNVLQETSLKVMNEKFSLCSKFVNYNSSIYYCASAIDDDSKASNVCYGDAGIFQMQYFIYYDLIKMLRFVIIQYIKIIC
jgi:hypothetical protein